MTDDEFKRLLETNSVDIRHHFDITAEQLRNEIHVVAEAVVRVDQKLAQTVAELNDQLDRSFSETQATIRFFGAR
jgi:hypothetical protein